MCNEFEDEFEEEDQLFESLSPVQKQEFYDYVTKQINVVMDKAESHGILFDLITKWPRDKQVAFEMAAVIENRVLTDDDED